ncbi:alpha/beta hydrolase [Actinomadura fulvescens]|uniref:AB hydrolase-1 domain-containing protein n=1 Tax=Actinomadura fulvescens TaxID=46160 RepID=A0ABN3QXF8_9ACTN
MPSTVKVTRGELAYDVEGTGPSACLIHQYREVTAKGPLANALTPHFRLHAINPVGLGGSSAPRESHDLTMESFADDLEDFRYRLDLPPWVVVGSSTGGMVALLHALRHPKAVRGLVLIGSAASRQFITGSLADPAHPRAAEVAAARTSAAQGAEGMAAFRTAMFRLSVADPHRTPEPPEGEDGHNSA